MELNFDYLYFGAPRQIVFDVLEINVLCDLKAAALCKYYVLLVRPAWLLCENYIRLNISR